MQTPILNTNYGNNKYWKTRRKRAITQARFEKYDNTFDQGNERQTDSNYHAWEQHIAMLQHENHLLINANV